MKKRSFYRPFFVAAGLLMAAAAATAQGQGIGQHFHGLSSGEYIVGQEVVSDTLADVGGSYDSGSYVGDMTATDAGFDVGTGAGVGNYVGRGYGQPDLFYNYYTQGNFNTSNAQMYVSPLPVPPNVGHTFFTYQPFHPEEMLYWHKNRYHNVYDNGRGMNRTRALYYSPPVRQFMSNLYWNKLRIPR